MQSLLAVRQGTSCEEFLVQWEGWGSDHNTWEPLHHLQAPEVQEMVKLLKSGKRKQGPGPGPGPGLAGLKKRKFRGVGTGQSAPKPKQGVPSEDKKRGWVPCEVAGLEEWWQEARSGRSRQYTIFHGPNGEYAESANQARAGGKPGRGSLQHKNSASTLRKAHAKAH